MAEFCLWDVRAPDPAAKRLREVATEYFLLFSPKTLRYSRSFPVIYFNGKSNDDF